MTSTSVKDVGSVLNGLQAAQGGARASSAGGFGTVLNGRTVREDIHSRTDGSGDRQQAAVKKAPGDSLKARDTHRERIMNRGGAAGKKQETAFEDIPEDELQRIMEVLETASIDMMNRIADVMGISPDKLQEVMQELDMDGLSLLDRNSLGELLMKLSGTDDPYALVTDGKLYENFKELTAAANELIGQAAQEMQVSPEQLNTVITTQAQQTQETTAQQMPENPENTQDIRIVVETAGKTLRDTQNQPVEEAPQADAEDIRQPENPQTIPVNEENTDSEAGEEQGQSRTRSDRHSDTSDGNGHYSALAQDVRQEQFQAALGSRTQETSQTSQSAYNADTQDIMRQIMDYMRVRISPENTSLEMALHPESLGNLHIQVTSRGGVLTANFIAQNEAVKTALESQMVQLRQSFDEQGVRVEAIEVTVESHAFERNLDQGRGQSGEREQNHTARRTRTRRINLTDLAQAEDLTQEETLAAEMMAANGGQVDYTA